MREHLHTARLEKLGITQEHLDQCMMPQHHETKDLVESERDIFDRPQLMTPLTLDHWHQMKLSAAQDGVTLQLVSAFRSIEYQCNIISKKLDKGQLINDIVKVSAIPGFSEHHTGRALDLSTPEYTPLEETFETSNAFSWLTENAASYNFYLSYPRNNKENIIYEPWHWFFWN